MSISDAIPVLVGSMRTKEMRFPFLPLPSLPSKWPGAPAKYSATANPCISFNSLVTAMPSALRRLPPLRRAHHHPARGKQNCGPRNLTIL
jgi:hypothetical protein